jgi:hypothetical protein
MTEGAVACGQNMRKEERNKWGFLEGGHDWKGETVYAVVPCKHIPA